MKDKVLSFQRITLPLLIIGIATLAFLIHLQDLEVANEDHYIAGTSRAQGDQEAAKIRSCIQKKAKISNVVHLEECLPGYVLH